MPVTAVTDTTGSTQTTVLIAGAGPAGLAAAAELTLHGVDCIVIEPRVTVSHQRPRAKTTNVRTMEHLRRWGLAETLREAAPLPVGWSQKVTFCDSLSGRRIVDFDGAFGLVTGQATSSAEAGQQVPQPVLEEVLRAHARRSPGVDLRLGHTVQSFDQDDDGVCVTIVTESSVPYRIRARYVLGCDGGAGVVRKQLGARYEGRSDARPNFNVVFRAPGLNPALGPAVQYWVVGGGITGLIGRLDLHGTWWAIFPGIDHHYGVEHAAQLITALVGEPVEHQITATDPWTARMLIADRFQDRRVFLVGESAHLNPPWGGHGFNTCVGDAVNIAWKIAAVQQGWAAPALLDTYETERRGVVEHTIATAESNMQALAGDLAADAASIRRAKHAEFHSLGLVLGYHYAGSPVVQPSDAAMTTLDVSTYTPSSIPGSRLPHHWLADGSALYDHLGAGLTLLGPDASNDGRVATLVAAAARRAIPLTVLDSPPDYPWHNEFLLVRPDQHIAWRAPDPSTIDLQTVTGHRAGIRRLAV